MLPYRLRTPVFGSVSENQKRRSDGTQREASTGGGPVQKAISRDLKAFQLSFLDRIQKEQQQQGYEATPKRSTGTGTGSHWTSGKAFGIFKELFGSAKIAMLHLLVPHPRCDREAYAQITYAACLEHFREAMKKSPQNSSLLEACAAIWTLYTLYETNPLLKTAQMTPMDYLPMGLQSRENPRALYRRAFRQPIRIDREHFALMLHLQERCRALLDTCCCGQALCPIVPTSSSFSTPCTCSVARDTITILERLSSCWDFCEYTGPVGLEAMAGHPDYPYREEAVSSNKSKTRKGYRKAQPSRLSTSTFRQPEEPAIPPAMNTATAARPSTYLESPSSTSTDLVGKLMKKYQNTIQAIHLGSHKTRLASQLRKTLAPVLPQEGKKLWSEIMINQLHGALSGGRDTEPQNQRGPVPINNLQEPNHIPKAKEPSEQASLQGSQGGHSCRLEVSEGVPPTLHSHLHNAFQLLLQREGPDFLAPAQVGEHHIAGKERDASSASDISALGGGGISVAVSQRHLPPIQNYLPSTASNSRRIPTRVAAIPASRKPEIANNQRSGTMWFLDLDPTLPNSDHDDSDDASHVSNISLDSELHGDDDNDDEASAATSAVGRRALDLLLAKVSKKSGKAKAKHSRKRKPPARKKLAPNKTDQSVATSVGAGGAALGSLLNQAGVGFDDAQTKGSSQNLHAGSTYDKNRMEPDRKRAKTSTRSPMEDESSVYYDFKDDEKSMLSSVGPGRAALDALMKQAVPKVAAARKPKKSVNQNHHTPHKPPRNKDQGGEDTGSGSEEHDDTVESVAEDLDNKSLASSVGPGRAALGVLLGRTKGQR